MNQDKINFLQWLINRMQFKYGCNDQDIIVQQLQETIELLKPKPININISDVDLDKILNKYYADFTLEKCDDIRLGFTEAERISFRDTIRNIVRDIVNKNIPKDFLIKG